MTETERPAKCFRCGRPIPVDRPWIQAGKSKFEGFHADCFAEFQKDKNKRQHRGLPERLYASLDEIKEEK